MTAKSALLGAIASSNRGLLASVADRQKILTAIAELETQNPTPNPVAAAAKLEGNWRLLYTTSDELLRIDQIPILKLGQVYQCVRTQDSKIYNIAEVVGVPFFEGIFSVVAQFQPVSDRRVQVQFQRAVFGFQKLIGYTSPDEFIQQIEAGKKFAAVDFTINRDRQGWLDITYLDDDLRIGRGNVGSVFVLIKG